MNETDSPQINLDATTQGFSDYELRTAAQDYQGHKATLPLLAVNYRPAAGVFGLEKQSHTAPGSLNENFAWQGQGFCAGILSESGERRILRAPFWLPKEWDAALNRCKGALFLHRGYPLLLDEDFEFSLPAKARQVSLPKVVENLAGPLAWKIEWNSTSETNLTARLHVELARGELTVADTPAFQKQLRELFSALGAAADFTLSP